MLSVLVAVGVGVALAVVTGVLFYKFNVGINDLQRQLNKVENKLSSAGSEWLASVFSDAVIGDVRALRVHVKQFVESDDITGFFLKNVALPLTFYTIHETAVNYPDDFVKVIKAVEAEKVKNPPQAASNG